MKKQQIILFFSILIVFACQRKQFSKFVVVDETDKTESIEQIIEIDSVWAGHPVDFCLYTHKTRQYIAYYNANRNMVVGQRNLDEDKFDLHILPPTFREEAGGTSTVLGWDGHNYITIGIDKNGYIHVSGNVHANPLTYFRSTKPNDISTLEQVFEMIGTEEKRTTYPRFMVTKEGDFLYNYRDGGSGNGKEIYNIYNSETKTWKRFFDEPLTDGLGLMSAYQTQPTLLKDGWYHMYWVWRDTPDCSTNHDLSYMKSSDLKKWYNAFGEPVELPASPDKKLLIVDPIPVKGGIINLAAKMVLDDKNKPVFTYHKYDSDGNIQLYTAQIQDNKWIFKQVTNWDYRWEFSGMGTMIFELNLKNFTKRADGKYEIDYWHIKYGDGTILLNDKFEGIGKTLKSDIFGKDMKFEGTFPGLIVQSINDLGKTQDDDIRYVLKWETLSNNRDKPRQKPWPKSSRLILYKLKKA
ncbi:MAG: hypothetical protein GW772_03075 [Flavobacteriia bacterium]|nr:hypothetical protein [Flavobacteriia bacterium]NCT59662.1 hypothetical protein [Flavobacteriia bacterium]